jgi:hypothetical protein
MQINDFNSQNMLSGYGAAQLPSRPPENEGVKIDDGFSGKAYSATSLKANLDKIMAAGDSDGRVIKDINTKQFADKIGRAHV